MPNDGICRTNHVGDAEVLSKNIHYVLYVGKPCSTYAYNAVQNLKGCHIPVMHMVMYAKQEIL